MSELVSVNGAIFNPQEAKISVYDRGFLYGDGVYEVTRSYGRVLFALEDHIDRLFRSAERVNLNVGFSKDQLVKELYRVYDAANQDDIYMRVVITRGDSGGKINLDPNSSQTPNIVIFIQELPFFSPQVYREGQDLITSTYLRNSKKALDPNVKSGNYLNNIMALGEAKRLKAFDAIMVNKDGFVTEGTTWNLFMVKNEVCITAPDGADILQGITRKHLRDLAKTNNIKWEERFFTPDELKKADEAFSSSSIKEVMGIRSVDGVLIGGHGKPGPVTLKMAEIYKAHVKAYCQKHSEQKKQ